MSPARRVVLLFTLIVFYPASLWADEWPGISSAEETWLEEITLPMLESQGPTVSGPLQSTTPARELLLIEPRPMNKDAASEKQANVYIYDYESDEAIHLIVNLSDRRVLYRTRVRRMQLPLNNNERARALSIAFDDVDNRRAIAESFLAITGRTLDSVNEIKFKAFVFHADSVSTDSAWNAQQCGLRRCAKLLLYTADNIALDMSPIIDLSGGEVLQMSDRRQAGG